MPLNTSGPISLRGTTAGQSIQQELGLSGQISLLDSAVRTLAGVPTGPVTMPTNFYGKANAFIFNQTISSNTNDYNLRNAAIVAGWDQVVTLQATITINSGVFVGSSSTSSAAFQTGSSFPAGSTLAIINNGSIVGRGGNGGGGDLPPGQFAGAGGGGGAGVVNSSGGDGQGASNNGSPGGNTTGGSGGAQGSFLGPPAFVQVGYGGNPGANGGLALLVSYPTGVTNNGTIGGGGGGGGQGGGGYVAASPRSFGVWAAGGAGGNLGSAGSKGADKPDPSPGIGGAGGAAGAAVNGNSNITWLATGTRLGAIS